MELPNSLTTHQVAEHYGITPARVVQLIRAGYISAFKDGWRYMVPTATLPEAPTWPVSQGRPKGSRNKGRKKIALNPDGPRGIEGKLLCASCLDAGQLVTAVRQSWNENVAGNNYCEPHAKEKDSLAMPCPP